MEKKYQEKKLQQTIQLDTPHPPFTITITII